MYETNIRPNLKEIDVAVFAYNAEGRSKGVVHTYTGAYSMLEHFGKKHLTDAKASAQSRWNSDGTDFLFCTECLGVSLAHKGQLKDVMGFRYNAVKQITRTHYNPMLAYSGFVETEPNREGSVFLWKANSKGDSPTAVDFVVVDEAWNKEGALRRLVDFFSAENLSYKGLTEEGKRRALTRCIRDVEMYAGMTVDIPTATSKRYSHLHEYTRTALQAHNLNKAM